jgi:hypothetical protein
MYPAQGPIKFAVHCQGHVSMLYSLNRITVCPLLLLRSAGRMLDAVALAGLAKGQAAAGSLFTDSPAGTASPCISQ